MIQHHARLAYGFAPAPPVHSERVVRCVDAGIKERVCGIVAQWHQSTVTHTTAVEQLLQMLVCTCILIVTWCVRTFIAFDSVLVHENNTNLCDNPHFKPKRNLYLVATLNLTLTHPELNPRHHPSR